MLRGVCPVGGIKVTGYIILRIGTKCDFVLSIFVVDQIVI